jgi:hypothetical protein
MTMTELHVDVVQDDLRVGVQRRVGIVIYVAGQLKVKDAFGPQAPMIHRVAGEVADQGDATRTLEAFAIAIEGRSIFTTEPHTWSVCPFGQLEELPLSTSDSPFRVPA